MSNIHLIIKYTQICKIWTIFYSFLRAPSYVIHDVYTQPLYY